MKKKFSKLLGIGLTVALISSLLTIAGPAMALTQPQVALTPPSATISAVSQYDVTFTSGKLVAGGNQIVLAFDAGVNISGLGLANVRMEALAGIGGVAFGPLAVPAAVTVTGTFPNPQTMTITLAAPQNLGAGALIGITITGVTNPSTPGDYSVTVSTQTAGLIPIEAGVKSALFAIRAPGLTPLPGVVTAYNSAGIPMAQSTSIQTACDNAGAGGRVEVGPGTYDEVINLNLASHARQTIVGIGDPGTCIISDADMSVTGGTVTVNVAGLAALGGVTLENLTITPNAFIPQATMVTLGAAATYVTIKDCTIASGTTSAVTINLAAAGAEGHKIQNCTITAQHATAARIGIIANGQVAVSDTTINVGASALTQAITSSSGAAPFTPTSVTGCTITGSSGNGIAVTGGVATIKDSTLSTLTTALAVTAGAVTVDGNTIDGCGSSVIASGVDAIEIAGGVVNMYNNTVSNSASANYAMAVVAGTVTAHFNNITDNAKNISAGLAVAASHNWWGSVDGPAFGSVVGAGVTTTAPVLGASITDAEVAFARNSLLTKNTLGVDVTCLNATGAPAGAATITIGISKYSANPVVSAPIIVGTGSVVAYYDLYVVDTSIAAATLTSAVQIKIYGAVSPYTKLYYAGGLGQQWGEPTTATGAPAWGVNVAGGYVYLTVTGGSPSILGLSGTPFVLLEDKTVAPPVLSEPTVGEYDIAIEPMFTWGTVPGAIRYEITLSEDPTFNIIEWSYNVDQSFYKADEALRYDTTYYWRVRGVLAEPYSAGPTWITPSTPWATGIFTTESEAVEAPETIVVEPPKPEVNVEIPPTQITVEPSSPVIPNYMLWIIIAVGAVLVIALIVLIVRTRRVV